MATKLKTGRLSNEEIEKIERLTKDGVSAEEIATTLNRDVQVVVKYASFSKANIGEYSEQEWRLICILRNRPFWTNVKKQFTETERELYEYNWAQYNIQFATDVTHAEESQICRAIELDILISRSLLEEKEVENQIQRLETVRNDELKLPKDTQDQDKIIRLDQEIAGLRGAQRQRNKQYLELVDTQSKLFSDLKVTRDQRFKEIQGRKAAFINWVKAFSDPQFRESMSRQAEIGKLAKQKELERLAAYHTYDDNALDRPILAHDTITEDDQLEH